MTEEEISKKADEFVNSLGFTKDYSLARKAEMGESWSRGYLAGLHEGQPKWHKVFINGKPYSYEYWDLPQDNLPQNENFYFVKLKNGFVKICELKYDHWSKQKCFYDLHGGKQSNVAEWLDYPTV